MTVEPPVVLFDLDDSFIAGNSFHALVREVLVPASVRGRGLRISTRLLLIAATALRGAGLVSRRSYKRLAERCTVELARSDAGRRSLDQFVGRLRQRVDPALGASRDYARARGLPTVLTTGALAIYAAPFGSLEGFDLVVSTEAAADGLWHENIGAEKRDRTLRALVDAGWQTRPLVYLADCADDLPLAEACQSVFWVSRNPASSGPVGSRGEMFAPERFESRIASLMPFDAPERLLRRRVTT
jgi:phosphoserine phosphatase